MRLKQIIAWMMAFVLTFSAGSSGLTAFAESVPGAAGVNTVPEGYIALYTVDDLTQVRENLDGQYILMADLDLQDMNWSPIGETADTPFSGAFDGNGHKIQGLQHTADKGVHGVAGFFGYLTGTVENLALRDVYMNAPSKTIGGITAVSTGTLRNCSVTGTLISAITAGGLCGKLNEEGLVEGCCFDGEIQTSSIGSYGGIVGSVNDQASITTCYNLGKIRAYTTYYAYGGGIAGNVMSTANPAISNCFNLGSVMATIGGGIAGSGTGSVFIDSCYSIGAVSGSESNVLFCKKFNLTNVTNCYYYDTGFVEKTEADTGVQGITLENLTNLQSYAGLDPAIWAVDGELPYLKALGAPFASFGQNHPFDGGRGLPYDPYRISSKAQLDQMRNYAGAAFVLTADLSFDGSDFAVDGSYYHEGLGWDPIRTKGGSFVGYVDGQGHIISGLTITDSQGAASSVGLFGSFQGGYIQNLILEDCNISAPKSTTGGIAGSLGAGAAVFRCAVSGKLTGNYVGGIIGNAAGAVEECYHSGQLSGYYVGGICASFSGKMKNCFHTGTLKGTTETGGIVCSARGDASVETCYTPIMMSATKTGAISNKVYGNASFTNCYFYQQGALQGCESKTVAGQIGLTEEQLGQKQSYTGFDFLQVWDLNTDAPWDMPYLRHVQMFDDCEENTSAFAGGIGTVSNPYLIETVAQLENVPRYPAACYRLEKDLDLSGIANWTSIGETKSKAFSGRFDGNGHTIKGLTIEAGSEDAVIQGLFGYVKGEIRNLHVEGRITTSRSAAEETALIAAHVFDYGQIRNCTADGSIKDLKEKPTMIAGGIVGVAKDASVITECTNKASIQNASVAGGIVGKTSNNAQIFSTANYGTIDASSKAGGIVGRHESFKLLTHHENQGSVSSRGDAGGIAGYSYSAIETCCNSGFIKGVVAGGIVSDGRGNIKNSMNISGIYAERTGGGIAGSGSGSLSCCYSIGQVSAGKNAGALIGYRGGSDTIENSYYYAPDGMTAVGSGQNQTTAKLLSLDDMKKQESFEGFDFENIWYMTSSQEGYAYPMIKDMPITWKETAFTLEDTSFFLEKDEVRTLSFSIDDERLKHCIWWYSSDPSVVTVNCEGIVFYKDGGNALITGISLLNQQQVNCYVTMSKNIADCQIEHEKEFRYDETEKTPEVVIRNGDYILKQGADYEISYSDNLNVGTGKITITGKGLYYGEYQSTFTIKKGIINTYWIEDYHGVYDGNPHTFSVIVLPPGGRISYNQRWRTHAGTTTVPYRIIKDGYYDYVGEAKITIEPLKIEDATIVLEEDSFVWDGTKKKPKVQVTDNEKRSFVEGVDYTIVYDQDCDRPGVHEVNVTFKGDYEGTAKAFYRICPAATNGVKVSLYQDYDDLRVTWDAVPGATGYKVYWKKADGKYRYSAMTKTTDFVKKNLSDGYAYTFKVVAYTDDGEETLYAAASKSATTYTLEKVRLISVKKAATKKVRISWENIPGETGYQISRSTKKSGTANVKSYAGTKMKEKTLAVSKNKTYYYKVRAYKTVDGKKIYGPWSNVKSCRLK